MEDRISVYQKRKYTVLNTQEAKEITIKYLKEKGVFSEQIDFGLPEVNDRYHIWTVPIIYHERVIGEIAIDAYGGAINTGLSSDISVLNARMDKVQSGEMPKKKKRNAKFEYKISPLNNMIINGKAECVLATFPEESVDLIFTSPPYFNARKEYSEYPTYQDYLDFIRSVIVESRRVLVDGRFFVMNSSHVLVPRASRNESSSRIPVPFDIHQIFMEEGFEFVDDIIWQKPEGAGWASGRGRRFSADRNPLQYKAVPVCEYVMVYRKKPTVLIDKFIRSHPNPEIIQRSKIEDGYEKTNVWYISPARDKRHPAIFPMELAEKVIKYYSFINDVVLDPFGGIGTTAKAAAKLERKFVSIELSEDYHKYAVEELEKQTRTLMETEPFEVKDLRDLPDKDIPETISSIKNKVRDIGYSDEEIESKLIDTLKDLLNKEPT